MRRFSGSFHTEKTLEFIIESLSEIGCCLL